MAIAKKVPVAAKKASSTLSPLKPIKSAFNKSTLTSHLAQHSQQDPRAVKAVLAALEATVLASIHKKGLGAFTLPGLMKVTAVKVAATKKRVGINPFTKLEQTFAAKPASTKVKFRALKKLKDAAL